MKPPPLRLVCLVATSWVAYVAASNSLDASASDVRAGTVAAAWAASLWSVVVGSAVLGRGLPGLRRLPSFADAGRAVVGWVVVPLLVVLGLVAAWACGLVALDLSLGGFYEWLVRSASTAAQVTITDPALAVLIQLCAITTAPIYALPLALCDELGFRCEVRSGGENAVQATAWTLAMLPGVLLGLWGASTAVLAVPGLFIWGLFLGSIRRSSRTVWPGVVVRGALYGAPAIPVLLAGSGSDSLSGGPLGLGSVVLVGLCVAGLEISRRVRRLGQAAPGNTAG